jgi:galactitol-specific phosphotransferase system IIB component
VLTQTSPTGGQVLLRPPVTNPTKGDPDGQYSGPTRQAVEGRLNNYLSPRQRAVATKTYKRRLAWYHGPDYLRTGMTGQRLVDCILAQPPEIQRLALDAIAEAEGRYSTSTWLRKRLPYDVLFHRGTLRIRQGGSVLAELVLESEEQYAAGEATLNPTGTLDEAPPGAFRLLCVCSMGLATGVVLRQMAETILRKLGVNAWLEVAAADDGPARVPFADAVLVTRDEEEVARGWGHPRVLVVENWLDAAESRVLRALLAVQPEVLAQRSPATLT